MSASSFNPEHTIRVLHVDDEPNFADTAAAFLERENDRFTIETAHSANDGLDRLTTTDFDCIVSDYDIPDQNGIELLETVRTEYPDLPFILFTGKGSEEVASDAISAGVTDYLQKESGTDQYTILANRIRNAVERYYATQARQRHLKAIETAREGISILNEDGEFIYVNEAYANLYGYDPAEMLGKHWELIYPNDETGIVREEILPTVADEGHWHGETTGLRADGTTFPEDHVVSQTEYGDLICTVRDQSNRREHETELWMKTRAMDTAPIGITISDPSQDDNPLIYVNDRFTEMTRYIAEEALGSNCRFLQGENTAPEPVAQMREAIDNEEPVTVELRNYRKDGTEFWNHVSISPVQKSDGEITSYVGFQQDVTEQKERERELERHEELIEYSPDLLVVLDEEMTVQFQSPPSPLFEWEPRDVGGENPLEHIHPDDHETVLAHFSQLLENPDQILSAEFRAEDATGTWRWIESRGQNFVGEEPIDGILAVMRDITARKEREQELKRKNDRLDEFASVVSHDLRNPLNVAKGRVELATEECDSEHLDHVVRTHDRMGALIEDLLALARQGEAVSDVEPVDLGPLVENCWENVDTAEATLNTTIDLTIHADRSRLEQLIENLIRNGVEHGGEDVIITVGELGDGFYVADSGPGIPPEDREDVFSSGFSTNQDGTGFGLAIARRICEAHGWEISATESDKGGARFDITGIESFDS